MYYPYTEIETNYLKSKDKKLGHVIEQLGFIEREVHPNLFSCVVQNIVGQQISAKALKTIWARMLQELGEINAESILSINESQLQSFGITFKKANYIQNFARKVKTFEFDLEKINDLSDEDAINELTVLDGIGEWTAEMLLLFSLLRPNIFSYKDIAIHRGLKMVYHHKKIDKKLFEKYRKRFSPYCTVASIYLWAVAGGALKKE